MTGSLFDISGRTIVVTGASSGLGASFARGLHAAGANVTVVARRADRVKGLATELGADRALAVVGDVTAPGDRAAILDATSARWGQVDALVNNAGALLDDHPDAFDEADEGFHRIMDVNVVSLFALSRDVAAHMKPRGKGSIVNIGSIFGNVAATGGASYVASKGAVHALTRELAVQWGPLGIRVNAIAPGFFPSEMTDHVFNTDGGRAMLRRTCALGRGGRLGELLGAVIYLCSDASTYCTGHTLVVDGGYTAR
jgi:NAD(P)-dependent dehydrogenase (short-subunit alcohol dehydrogenase family)